MTRIVGFLQDVISSWITLVIIGLGITLFTIFMPWSDYLKEEATSRAQLMETSRYSSFDGTTVSGSTSLSAVRKFYTRDYFFVYYNMGTRNFVVNPSGVYTSAPAINFTTGQIQSSAVSVVTANLEDETSPYYIPYQSRFKSTLVRDDNGKTIGILFRKY